MSHLPQTSLKEITSQLFDRIEATILKEVMLAL
jgi:hypothetical protein